MELLSKLGIDWGLLTAQVVNFMLLLGILSFFVYTPLLNLLDERRARIAQSMRDAKRIENQVKELEAIRVEALFRIDQESGVIIEKTKQQAEKMKQEILETAKKEAETLLARGRQQLTDERSRIFREVQGVLSGLIVRMTEKILEREFSKADQDRVLSSLQKELPSMLR